MGSDAPLSGLENLSRTTAFWTRAGSIYLGYKAAQLRALVLRAAGWNEERLADHHWAPHHEAAGKAMYGLCVDLRGFYLKASAFACLLACLVGWLVTVWLVEGRFLY
jgi:hypothetical protein